MGNKVIHVNFRKNRLVRKQKTAKKRISLFFKSLSYEQIIINSLAIFMVCFLFGLIIVSFMSLRQ